MKINLILLFAVLLLISFPGFTSAAPIKGTDKEFQEFCKQGEYEEGVKQFRVAYENSPGDNAVAFKFAFLLFMKSGDTLIKNIYRYGIHMDVPRQLFWNFPFDRIGPRNPQPEELSYEGFVEIVKTYKKEIEEVRAVLEPMGREDFKVEAFLRQMNWKKPYSTATSDKLPISWILSIINPRITWDTDSNPDLKVHFDRGDASWLLGYTHVLSAFCEMILAYDSSKFFNHAGQYIVEKPVGTPVGELLTEPHGYAGQFKGLEMYIPMVAQIHLMDYELVDETGPARALEHIKESIRLSRVSWEYWLEETDNDFEFVPSPTQNSVFLNVTFNTEQLRLWYSFLREMEFILEGEKLLPFWRGESNEYGINVKKVFTEPRDFDLVMWIQGSDVVPYLEKGELMERDFWRELNNAYGGRFWLFAAFVN